MDRAQELTEAILDPIRAYPYWPAAHQCRPIEAGHTSQPGHMPNLPDRKALHPKGASTYVHRCSTRCRCLGAAATACEGEVNDCPCNARYRCRRWQRPRWPRNGPDFRGCGPPGRHDRPARGEPRRGDGQDCEKPRRLRSARARHFRRSERRPWAHPRLDRTRGRGGCAARPRGGSGRSGCRRKIGYRTKCTGG